MMKRFLGNILWMLFPLLFVFGGLEYFFKQKDASYYRYKRDYIQKNIDKIEGIVMGPSHIAQAINPEFLNYEVAPIALPGSAINIDLLMLKAFLEKSENVKFILFDLSQGYLENHHGHNWIMQNKLRYYFKVSSRPEVRSLFYLRYPLRQYIKKKNNAQYNKWGVETKLSKTGGEFRRLNYNDSLIVSSKDYTSKMKKHNFLNDKIKELNIGYLNDLISKCKKENIKLIFISPPKYYLYNQNLIPEHFSRREEFLNEVVDNENVFFFDYETRYQKESQYFYDVNHLNFEGAKIFTGDMNMLLSEVLKDTN